MNIFLNMLTVPEDKKPDLSVVPKSPGCYIYKDDKDEIIYIGKAKSLKNLKHSAPFHRRLTFNPRIFVFRSL